MANVDPEACSWKELHDLIVQAFIADDTDRLIELVAVFDRRFPKPIEMPYKGWV
jgi:hypothetical protein